MASAVDIGIGVAAAVFVSAFMGLVAWAAARRDDRVGDWLERSLPGLRELSERLERSRAAFFGIRLTEAVRRRNRRSYGQRLMRIRRVDAADTGSVRVRSAILDFVVAELIRSACNQPARIAKQRAEENFEKIRPELTRLARDHADDEMRYLREFFVLSSERHANKFTAGLLGPAIQIAVHVLTTVLFPKRQTLPELTAGIVTVTDTRT